MNLSVESVSWHADAKPIIEDILLNVDAGELVGLIGPNGSGKSTLLRCIYRVLKPMTGQIALDGRSFTTMPVQESARRMAVVVQESSVEFEFTVREMVLMGRTPHKTLFAQDTVEDWQIVEQALTQVHMDALAEQRFNTLSGGEKQRVLLARALAQQPQFLVLDELTNHLDIRYQLEILDLVCSLGVTTLAALHDLNLAAFYCDRIYVLQQGRIVACGSPNDVLTADLIRSVYNVAVEVMIHPHTQKPHITFFPASLNRRQAP